MSVKDEIENIQPKRITGKDESHINNDKSPRSQGIKSLPKNIQDEYKEKLRRRENAARAKQEKKSSREKRSRVLIHAGGLLEMTGLLQYTFPEGERFDNYQDNLRANLLVGALLSLSEQLRDATPQQLSTLAQSGRAFRKMDKAQRKIAKVNPSLPKAPPPRPLLVHEGKNVDT